MKLARIPNVYDIGAITLAKIVFFGAGSVGSWAMSKMAYPFRQIVIVDPKNLKQENVERHLLGTAAIGKPKSEGCRDWLIGHGVPPASVIACVGTDEDVFAAHTDASLAIVSVDDVHVKDRINRWCVKHGIPMLVGSVYAQGLGGQVVVLPKPKEVCFTCAQFALGNLDYKGRPDGTDYGIDPTLLRDSSGAPQAVPALGAPVGMIADHMALIALDILAKKGGDVRPHVLMAAFTDWVEVRRIRPGKILSTLTSYIVNMGPLGMQRNMQLGKLENGLFSLQIRNSAFPLELTRWTECTLHSEQSNTRAEDI